MEPVRIDNIWKWGTTTDLIVEGCGIVNIEFYKDYEWGYISSLTVHPSRRKQGIGTRLIEEAEKVINEEGFDEAHLKVQEDHVWQKEWYERLGYKVTCKDDGYYTMRKIFGRDGMERS